jgi:HD-like signal output (HDOD) protein
MDAWKSRWGAPQWAAFFENQALPVMPSSKLMLAELESSEGEMLSPKDLLDIVLQDPMLCLCLMREAERRKSHRLDHETTTALAAILQLGVDEFRKLLMSSPEIDQRNLGLLKVGERARIAAQVAQVWAVGRMDINPEEVAVAALLAGCGDLLLWVYAPEIPEKAERKLASGRAKRSADAQVQACGFTFKDLTLQCAERWKLPALVIQLLRGSDSERAQLTRVCSNTARHLLDESETANLALATDLVEVIELIPNASLEWLVDGLQMLPEARRLALLDKANEFLLEMPPPP